MRDKLFKYISLTALLGLLGTAITLIFNFGKTTEANEAKQFDSAAQKVEVVTYVKQAPSTADLRVAKMLDSIANEAIVKNANDAIRSRAGRDKRDSLTAVTIYQMKEDIKTLKNN